MAGKKPGGSGRFEDVIAGAIGAVPPEVREALRATQAETGDPRFRKPGPPPEPEPEREPEREAAAEAPEWRDDPRDAPGSMLDLMARAQMVWMQSGVRYWGDLADLLARRGPVLADLVRRAGRDMSDADKLRLMDEARQYLQEVGDISLREAKGLQHDLRDLEAALRDAVGRPASGPRRHGRPRE